MMVLYLLICVFAVIQGNLIGEDNRMVLSDSELADYQPVGLLVFDDKSFCTGTLISEGYVLSAGSCFYQDGQRRNVTLNARFYPTRNVTTGAPFASIVSIEQSTTRPDRRQGLDYVFLQLNQLLGNEVGYFAIYSGEEDIMSFTVTMVHYAHKYTSSPAIQRDIFMTHLFDTDKDTMPSLTHNGDTPVGGATGCPLLFDQDGTTFVVGIHTGGLGEQPGTQSVNQVNDGDENGLNFGVAFSTFGGPFSQISADSNEADTDSPDDQNGAEAVEEAPTPAPKSRSGSSSSRGGKESGDLILYVCIGIVAVVWIAVIILMKRMAL